MSEDDSGLLREAPLQSQVVFSPLSGVVQLFGAEFTEQNGVEPLLWSGCCCRCSSESMHLPWPLTCQRSALGGAHSSPVCLFPCNSPGVFAALRGKHDFVSSSFLRWLCQLLCLCLCPLGCWCCLTWWSVTCSVCLFLLLGCLKEISSWDLLCFLQSKSCYCLCEFSLLYPECSLYLLVFL